MMRRKIPICCLSFIPLLFFTCNLPPLFDEGTSLAFITARKLTFTAHYGPLLNSNGSLLRYWEIEKDGLKDVYYVPNKSSLATNFDKGYLIALSNSDHLTLKYIFNNLEPDGSYKMKESWSNDTIPIPPLDNFNNSFYFTTAFMTPIVGLKLNANDANFEIWSGPAPTASPLLVVFTPSPLPTPAPSASPGATPALTEYPNPPGSTLTAVSIQNKIMESLNERLLLLTWDANYKFCESYADVSNTSSILNYKLMSANLDLPVPPDVSQAFYLHNFSSTPPYSYLSYYRDGLFHAFRWSVSTSGSLTVDPMPAVMHRLDTILSTGQLFAVVNQTAYIYNIEGKKEFDFPLGDLHFAGEIVPGNNEPVMVFTLVKLINGDFADYSGDGIFLDVYTIYTKDLSKLK